MADPVLVPHLELLVGRKSLKGITHDLLDISVSESLGMNSEFTLRLHTFSPDKLKLTWVDSPSLAIGSEVEIKLGYVEKVQSLMVGQVLSLDLQFGANDASTLTVKGQDLRHLMGRTEVQKIHEQKTEYAIAQEIAAKYGLLYTQYKGAASASPHEYLAQTNMTDLAFLYDLAQTTGNELMMNGRTLLFQPLDLTAKPVLTLTPETGLQSFSTSISSSGRVGKVVVRTGESSQDEVLTGEVAIPKGLPGLLSTDKVFDDGIKTVVDPTLETQAEVDQAAKNEANRLVASYLTASGSCFGNTKVRPGALIQIKGLGERFSLKYLVTSATHSFSMGSGYTTSFELCGNLWRAK